MAKMTRDEMRTKVFSTHKPRTITVNIFGVDVEFRQPPLGAILDGPGEETEDQKTRVAKMFVKYAYVPGSNEKLFEPGDVAAILQWPFGEDLRRAQEAINNLVGVDVAKAKEDLLASPLAGGSPTSHAN